jgi:hypothetical protein
MTLEIAFGMTGLREYLRILSLQIIDNWEDRPPCGTRDARELQVRYPRSEMVVFSLRRQS